jgi:hypothetical protein
MASKPTGSLSVQKVLRSVLLSGLDAVGYDGWTVVEFGNPEFINYDKCLTMQLLRQKRVGWQGHSYEIINEDFKRKDEWLTEYQHQVQVLLKRPKNATAETLTAEDVADTMIAWLNGPGVAEFRKYGVAPLRIDGASVFVYNDNSDLYQKRAVFTVKIQVPKELTVGENVMDQIIPGIKPV